MNTLKEYSQCSKHLSVAFVPFIFSETDFSAIQDKLSEISVREDFSFFDSIKYHKHIRNMISKNGDYDKSAFFKIYRLNDNATQRLIDLNFNSNNNYISISEKYNAEFTQHNYLLLNKLTRIGFIVSGFIIVDKYNKGIAGFSECEFFRFIRTDEDRYKFKVMVKDEKSEVIEITKSESGLQYKFKGSDSVYVLGLNDEKLEVNLEKQNRILFIERSLKRYPGRVVLKNELGYILESWNDSNHEQKTEISSFNLIKLFEKGFYKQLFPYFTINSEKPVVLHLFYDKTNIQFSSEKLETYMFRTIRIKPKSSPIIFKEKSDNTEFDDIFQYALMDGAVVIDTTKNLSSDGIFNKYFPAFILVLNQREVMLKHNDRLSQFSYEDLSEAKENSLSDENVVVSKIKELKSEVAFFKFKQLIYSVSFYDEIDKFYKLLSVAFDINILLRDNEESIKEIHDVLVQIEKNNEERFKQQQVDKEVNQSRVINSILGAIGCLGLFSFLKDLLPFWADSQYYFGYKIFSVTLPLLMLFFVLSLSYKSSK